MVTREDLHRAVDELSEEQARWMLELLQDPVVGAFRDAPEDDEPFTEKDEAAISEADADFAAGRTVSHEEIVRKHG